jgi:2-polyprenyl-3-methyl-5-hydroxy-6-metoxy-1,4-benzoquinol methylase
MELNERIDALEKTIEIQRKQIQNINKVLLEAVRITTLVEKAAKLVTAPAEVVEKRIDPPLIKAEELPPPKIVKVDPPVIIELAKPEIVVPTVDKTALLTELLNSPTWPAAVDPSLICDTNSEQDKEDRAEGILDLIIDVHLENLKFLDFGCGEGHVVNKSRTQNPKLAIGYDLKEYDKWNAWEKAGNVNYTNQWNVVKNSGPYNIVLLYDVVDHIESTDEELVKRLKELKSILAPNAKVYVRCHPWSSRHGTHLYRQLNKAYVHMVFTDEEIKKMGYTQEKARKFKHPVTDYNNLWTAAGFKVINGPHHSKEGVEAFFKDQPLVKERIQEHYKDSNWEILRSGDVFPSEPMESQFIDYTLA